jgi:hypothetical protein
VPEVLPAHASDPEEKEGDRCRERSGADLGSQPARAPARLIIENAAHPDAREELRGAAAALGLD